MNPGESRTPPGRCILAGIQGDLPVAELVLHLPLAVVGDLDDDLAVTVEHGGLADILPHGVEGVRQGLERRPPPGTGRLRRRAMGGCDRAS